ncbi:plasmid mobilization relaxosome protein MobC [Parapedobacter sp. ISTM3]|uniref:plasmid mobilization protein n=1 Tax=Parapedobacter sp. ISTM3 TaxID=2800130 RepID=UPI00190901BD|nr:plasmid mobilization relaxosome protein MobC [Parapedobacter sp. ISTM3]MBK1439853.1 plasmid mobilization relaxosome protein MobC [Parapedobacter sp. ISTM3]
MSGWRKPTSGGKISGTGLIARPDSGITKQGKRGYMGKTEKLTCRIHTRVTAKKYRELSTLLQRSRGIRSHSALLRNLLDDRKITVETHDDSLDAVMERLSEIRKELQRIGTNINQITRRFHLEELPEARLVHALEVQQLYGETDRKVEELLIIVDKLSRKWLPES